MKTFLFIPALLAGDYHGFMVKIAVVVLLWMIVIIASIVDLSSGIAASKRIGRKRTTSYGLRRTLSKDLQYLTILAMLLAVDIALSSLTPYMAIFNIPLLSIIGTIAITVVETLSVIENTRKGRTEEEDKVDDIQRLVVGVVKAVGTERLQQFLEALQDHIKENE